MIYLDTTILVPALHERHENHRACVSYITNSDAVTSTHALAETFSTLTGAYRVRNEAVAEALDALMSSLRIEPIANGDYRSVFRDAKRRGISGGLIYDALHVAVARRLKVSKIITFNTGDFKLLSPDIEISEP
jgi:predicted nucleic acid-binding protein